MNPGVGTLLVFSSIWGHWAGGPGDNPEDVKWLDQQIRTFIEPAEVLTGMKDLVV